jgi:hypothetical protein
VRGVRIRSRPGARDQRGGRESAVELIGTAAMRK